MNPRQRALRPIEAHALWSSSYDAEPNPIVALERRVLGPLLEPLEGKRLIDAGCGTGRWIEHAASRGAVALGVDRSVEMLARARAKTGAAGRLACGDLLRLPCRDGSADVVLCALSIAYVDPLEEAVAALARAARRGGVLWTTDLHPDAVARGWSRSFRTGGVRYTAQSHPYTLARLEAAGRGAGIELEERVEPALGPPERPLFQRAGRDGLFEEACAGPALLICRWRRG